MIGGLLFVIGVELVTGRLSDARYFTGSRSKIHWQPSEQKS